MSGTSEYQKQEQWRTDVKAFGLALWNYWQWWIATISSFAVLVILQWAGKINIFPLWVIWTIGISGVLVASFRAWRDQRRLVEAREIEIAQLKHEQEYKIQNHNAPLITEFVGDPNKLSFASVVLRKCSKCGQNLKIENPIFRAADNCVQTVACPECQQVNIVQP